MKEYAALESLVTVENRTLNDAAAASFLKQKAKVRDEEVLKGKEKSDYDAVKAKLEAQAAKFTTDSQGRVYRKSNHKSASKTMGGVQNTTIFDKDGNIINLIHDEHDLFGVNLPWMSRMINMSTPQVSNIFKGTTNTVAKADQANKLKYMQRLAEEYGVTIPVTQKGTANISKKAMSNALEEAILKYQPKVNMGHIMRSGVPQTMKAQGQMGLLGMYSQEDNE